MLNMPLWRGGRRDGGRRGGRRRPAGNPLNQGISTAVACGAPAAGHPGRRWLFERIGPNVAMYARRRASARNSRASARVRLATDTSLRSPHSRRYGNAGMSVMCMPPHDASALADGPQAMGTSSPTGAKMMAASRGSGGSTPLSPAQAAPSVRACNWATASPGRCRHAGGDVARRRFAPAPASRAEPVHAQAAGVASRSQRAPADQAGAHPRRHGFGRTGLRQRIHICGFGQHVRRKAAVARITGERRRIAEVLASGQAERAAAASPGQPGGAGAAAGQARVDALACLSTMPITSCPGVTGYRRPGSSPSTTCRSVRQTAHASTFSSTWPGPGRGVGNRSG